MENKSFEELDQIQELTQEQLKVLSKLKDDKAFQMWRELAEDFQMRTAYLFLRGGGTPKDITNQRDYFRGRFDMYTKLMRVVDKSDELIQQAQKENDEE